MCRLIAAHVPPACSACAACTPACGRLGPGQYVWCTAVYAVVRRCLLGRGVVGGDAAAWQAVALYLRLEYGRGGRVTGALARPQ